MNSRVWFWLILAVFFVATLTPVMNLLPEGTDTATLVSISVLIMWAGGAVFSLFMGAVSLKRS